MPIPLLSTIAVFILATTKKNGRHVQEYPTYFESRMLPIFNTFGTQFTSTNEIGVDQTDKNDKNDNNNLFFVFGTNDFDMSFLKKRKCRKVEVYTDDTVKNRENRSRKLKARTPQTKPKKALEKYACPVGAAESYSYQENLEINKKLTPSYHTGHSKSSSSIQREIMILRTANCTGEYFGIGPTCRCQESMRYFNHMADSRGWEWFMFLDDDMYVRPYALKSLLDGMVLKVNKANTLESNSNSNQQKPLVFQSSSLKNGFYFSKVWQKAGKHEWFPKHSFNSTSNKTELLFCAMPGIHTIAPAQPAIINRAAMSRMRASVDANGLTDLQKTWGGTHDYILGLLFWLHGLPLYAFKAYLHVAELQESKSINKLVQMRHRGDKQQRFQPSADHYQNFIFFHKIQNFKRWGWDKSKKDFDFYQEGRIASHYDLAKLLLEDIFYKIQADSKTYTAIPEIEAKYRNSARLRSNAAKPAALLQTSRAAVIERQEALGRMAAQTLEPMLAERAERDWYGGGDADPKIGPLGGVLDTVFRDRARTLHTKYALFTPADCQIHPTTPNPLLNLTGS